MLLLPQRPRPMRESRATPTRMLTVLLLPQRPRPMRESRATPTRMLTVLLLPQRIPPHADSSRHQATGSRHPLVRRLKAPVKAASVVRREETRSNSSADSRRTISSATLSSWRSNPRSHFHTKYCADATGKS